MTQYHVDLKKELVFVIFITNHIVYVSASPNQKAQYFVVVFPVCTSLIKHTGALNPFLLIFFSGSL